MVNLSHQELKETQVEKLPNPSLDVLRKMREDACSSSSANDFKLQAQQRFLRRVLSPDAPTQNLLMAHGTGTGKTCTAIQIAEEYILRPEFQDKKVLVLANPSVQENFKNQIFDISRVNVDADGLLLSKQCTGRRYLDILQRAQSQPLKWTDRASRQRLAKMASRIIGEFYEVTGYAMFGNTLKNETLTHTTAGLDAWIHENFDNRLIIVDEAHNLRDSTETSADAKIVSAALKRIVQTANGITLVLLTATPMYDTFEEIIDYFNLFLWNSRKQSPDKFLKANEIFLPSGEFVNEDAQSTFRGLCESYVSVVRGENPFTFPFRLPPPKEIVAAPLNKDVFGKKIETRRKYLTLAGAQLSEFQESIVRKLLPKSLSEHRIVCVYPDNQDFSETFQKDGTGYKYIGEQFLAPSKVANYSAKFASVMNCIQKSKGIVFVFSNMVEDGAQLFAMCLEEFGFTPAFGNNLLTETSGEIQKGTKGKYALLTGYTSPGDIKNALSELKSRENVNGDNIRIIVASPKVSEGVDFRYVRQIHILDPWFNMSRLDQVIGRGMRTCSHSLLPFEEQNCTVYMHVCRYKDESREALDEYMYRHYAEEKAIAIAKVKKVIYESAMDCSLEKPVNELPKEWLSMPVLVDDDKQIGSKFVQMRSQPSASSNLTLKDLQAPTFIGDYNLECRNSLGTPDPDHERPLSAILDVRDEILDRIIKIFKEKPIWKQKDLLIVLKKYDPKLVKYILQNAVAMRFQLKDPNGRVGHLEAKKGLFAFGIGANDTMVDRLIPETEEKQVSIIPEVPEEEEEEEEEKSGLDENIDDFDWIFEQEFSDEVKKWYYIDHVATPKERVNYLIDILNDGVQDAPFYASNLAVYDEEEDDYFYFINDKFYNSDYDEITPIGSQKDAYDEWVSQLKQRFFEERKSYFGTMKEKNVLFNLDHTSDVLRKAEPSKTLSGRMCTTYKENTVEAFIQWLGQPAPTRTDGSKVKKGDRCMYLGLAVRKAALENKDGLVWFTPDEWAVLNQSKVSEELRKRIRDSKE